VVAVLALLSSALWGSADFLGGTLSRRLPALVVVGASQAVGLLTIGIVAVAAGAYDAPLDYLPWAVLAGLSGMVGLTCFYVALAVGTMGIVSPIAALGVVVPVFIGLAGGEVPAAEALAGIAVAIVGVVLASGPELAGRAGLRPVLLAGVSAVGFGIALYAIARGSDTSTLMTMVSMRLVSVVLLGVVVMVQLGRPSLGVRDLGLIAVVGVGDVLANLCFGVASTKGDLPTVAVLGSLYPVATVLLARGLHGERLGRIQQLGVGAALVGVVLISHGSAA
jgi:drug/metabolite transporter (DMT)-like permease